MKTEDGLFTFESTGRQFEADRRGLISLSNKNELFYGYDGRVEVGEVGYDCTVKLWDEDFLDDNDLDYQNKLTPEEKKELSIYMINRWAAFGNVTPFIAD